MFYLLNLFFNKITKLTLIYEINTAYHREDR